MEEQDARYFFLQILWGVAYCHGRKVCHRDLKLENLLLSSTRTVVKIADFGFAKNIGGGSSAATILGTARYVAPEMLNGDRYDGYKAGNNLATVWRQYCTVVVTALTQRRLWQTCGRWV